MARLTAVEAPAPFDAIHATKNEKTTATSAMNTGPGFEPLMNVGEQEADHVADEDAGDGHHHAGIHPVVKVRAPADNELGDAGILERLSLESMACSA